MTKIVLLAALAAGSLPLPVAAQSMSGMDMPGMKMPPKPAAKPKPKPRRPAARKTPPARPTASPPRQPVAVATPPDAKTDDTMSGMDMSAPPASAPAPTTPVTPSMPGMEMSPPSGPKPDMAISDMPGMNMPGGTTPFTEGSGTARLPGAEGMMHGLHLMTGGWMVMVHGYAWGAYTAQSGPRGRDEAFVESMAMISADRDLGGATLSLRSMLSLEPLMGAKGYPSLFATGETANGVTPLVDRQHPHDLFMELSAKIEVPLGGGVSGFVYGGPVAEPALGPSAFMHRSSAKYLPLAPITHHWFDSTHITFGVVTAGLSSGKWQIEGSAFRGREPDEHRWDIETPKLDSWSVRATWNPSPYWSAQASYGRLKSPEALEPDTDEARTTATVQYARGGFSALAGFAVKNRLPGRALTAWLGEANWDLTAHHSIFGRVENVANDELFPAPTDPLHDAKFRVTRAELGYAYRLKLVGPVSAAIGGNGFVVAKPSALDAAYGKTPVGWTGFIKLSLGG